MLFIDHCSTCYRCRWLIALLVMSIVDGEIVCYLIVMYLPCSITERNNASALATCVVVPLTEMIR